jgi:DNA-binding NarL/FixJ family response regulator
MLRIAVLTDDRLFHAGLGRILETDPTLAVVADTDTAAVDVLLIDSRVKGALDACAAQKLVGGAKVLMVAATDDDA